MRILQWLLQTDSSVVGLILRITLAVVIFPHALRKCSAGLAAMALREP